MQYLNAQQTIQSWLAQLLLPPHPNSPKTQKVLISVILVHTEVLSTLE